MTLFAARGEERIEATYKAREVEGVLDIYFYRPVGLVLARLCRALRLTPTGVSMLGALTGVVAGHLYYYRSLRLNLAGMLLHVFTNALDNADGQLARLTNRGSLAGAVADGIADYVVFISVYVHLCLRHIAGGGSQLIWLLAALAGISHALQSLVADCYRDAYLYFVNGKTRAGDADERSGFAARIYRNYTRQQAFFAPELARLRETVGQLAPPDFVEIYQQACRPLIAWGNALATNARMIVLFALLLLGRPSWYFVVEVTVLNAVLAYLLLRERAAHRSILSQLRA